MRPSLPVLCLLTATLALGGCKSRPIPEPERILVPDRLSQQDVEVAILAAMTMNAPPAAYDPNVELSEAEFDTLIWSYYVAAPSRSWGVESREPGRIVGVIERKSYRLRAQAVYDEQAVRVSIVDSTGLGQEDGQIHRRAVAWIRKLEQRIRRELDRLDPI